VVVQSKVWICGYLLTGIAALIPVGGMDVSLVTAVCCKVEVFAMG